MVELISPSGARFGAFPSGDEQSQRGVLIVHDWWGIKPYNHEWARWLNEAGFFTLVVDLYDGYQPTHADAASRYMREIDQEVAAEKLMAAVDYLAKGGRKVAVLGWSFGGLQAQHAALDNPESVDALVFYYSRMVMDAGRWEGFGGKVLGVYAEGETTWPEKQKKFSALMARLGIDYRDRSYPAGHGFVNPEGERYNPAAEASSREQVLAFLQGLD